LRVPLKGPSLLGFREAGGKNPTLSAILLSAFLLSISHDINETRILSATASFFAEMLSNSAIPQAEIARVTFPSVILIV